MMENEKTKETQMKKTDKKTTLKWQVRTQEFRKSLEFSFLNLFFFFELLFIVLFIFFCVFYQMLQKREVLSMGSTKGMAAFGGGILLTFLAFVVKQIKA